MRKSHPNGVQEVRSYYNREWLQTLEVRQAGWMPGNTPEARFTYLYGAAGNLLSETDRINQVHSFAYDSLYRLISESHPDFGASPIEYQYDKNGNRTRRTHGTTIDYYGVNGATNRLEWVNRGTNAAPTFNPPQSAPFSSFLHGGNGRLIRRHRRDPVTGVYRSYDFQWDGDDRLREVKEGASSRFTGVYGLDGLRAKKTDAWTGEHYFSWGSGGVLHDSGGGGITYTPGLMQEQAGVGRFFHSDWLGSTRSMSDGSGMSFPAARRHDGFGPFVPIRVLRGILLLSTRYDRVGLP